MNNKKIKHAIHALTRSIEAHVYTIESESNQSTQTLAVLIVPKPNIQASVTTAAVGKLNKKVLTNFQSNAELIEDNKIVYDFFKDIDYQFDETTLVQDPRSKASKITHKEITSAWVALSAQQKKQHVHAHYTSTALSLGISSTSISFTRSHLAVRQLKRWICSPKTHDFVKSLAPENIDVNLIVKRVLVESIGHVSEHQRRPNNIAWIINKVLYEH